MKQLLLPLTLFLSTCLMTIGFAQDHSSKTKVGPENGSLIIVGGGATKALVETFIELAGGKDVPLLIIPTASGDFDEEGLKQRRKFLTDHGATNVTVLHTTDPAIADTGDFAAPLKSTKGVWFSGGRQWRLVDSYKGTKVEKLLWDVLERGGVLGGSSAGATIQGSYLARGDTGGNQVMIGDHEVGFGYLRNVAIDQHNLARNRHFDMFTILKEYPHLLGIGIDEKTALVVQGDQFEVIGESYVTIYDGTFWSKEGTDLKEVPDRSSSFYFLAPGDRYDLAKREVINRRQ